MHTRPEAYTLGWKGTGARKIMVGGRSGYDGGKERRAEKFAPNTIRHGYQLGRVFDKTRGDIARHIILVVGADPAWNS